MYLACMVRRSAGILLLLAVTAPLRAQSGAIAGVVRDSAGSPLVAADVTIRPADARTRTDSLGRFSFANLRPGEYAVRARFIGYSPVEVAARVVADSQTSVTFVLAARVVQLDTVVATAECHRFRVEGFFCRQRAGKGLYLDIDDIDAANLGYPGVGDLFWGIEGYRVDTDAMGRRYPVATSGWRCLVTLINGRPATRANPAPPTLDYVVGAEIYTDPDDVPVEYQHYIWMPRQGRQPARRCSVVVYWTNVRGR
jgi:hypothetical protein